MTQLLTLLAQFESHSSARQKSSYLPGLIVLSDEARGYALNAQIARWGQSAAFIERTYGGVPLPKQMKDQVQLATCTPRQARAAKLDGLHWPQKRLGYRRRSATAGLLETTAAHSGLAIAKASSAGFDAILVSTAFASDSPSATRPLGGIRLARLQRAFPTARLYALGGITLQTTKKLSRTQVHGIALVSFSTK